MEQPQKDNSHASAQSRAEGENLTDVLAAPTLTELGTKLLELRHRYIAAGGKLYTLDEINDEVRDRRG